jgi:hypothetical protein
MRLSTIVRRAREAQLDARCYAHFGRPKDAAALRSLMFSMVRLARVARKMGAR